MDPLNQWKCPICNVVVQASSKSGHIYGKRHRAQKNIGLAPWTCDVCALTTILNNKDSHLAGARHRDAVRAASERSLWTCSVCGLAMTGAEKENHVAAHARAAAEATTPDDWQNSEIDVESGVSGWDDDPPIGSTVDWSSEEGAEYASAVDESQVAEQRLRDLRMRLDAALRDRDIKKKELASVRKAWDEKEHTLLMKMDELRAKIVTLDAHLDATKAECTIERNLRISAEQEKTSRTREAEVVEGLNAKLKEALVDKERLTEAVDRKAESIRTGQSILSLARRKLSDVTSVRDALHALAANLAATIDTLRKETATQASQIQTLQQELDLANQRWSSHGQEITDEQLIWKDDEEVEGEKRQQKESIRQARERLEKMRRDELEQKAEAEAKERKFAEEQRAREAEEEKKRRDEEERRQRETEKQEQEKRQAYERWRNASALEILRHQSLSRTRFQAHNGLWTTSRALERFLKLLGEFHGVTFSVQRPLTFWSVPWPILANPLQLDPGKIDWAATETFFIDVKDVLTAEEYKEMVLRAQRTFHPDRWVGKLGLILDNEARESLKKVINTVAQVVNSLVTR